MIGAGAAGVHYEDQLSSEKKCGRLGGEVLIPTGQHIKTLNAARLAADVCNVPSLVVARTDAGRGHADDLGHRRAGPAVRHRRAHRGGLLPGAQRGRAVYRPRPGLRPVLRPDLDGDLHAGPRDRSPVRRDGPEGDPEQLLAYNCSPSFNWSANVDAATIGKFRKELAAMGYRFQFITLAGFHALNYSMFELASGFATEGMPAFVGLQEAEFAAEKNGYTATQHQREAGTGYFDLITEAISPDAETVALAGSSRSRAVQGLSGAQH